MPFSNPVKRLSRGLLGNFGAQSFALFVQLICAILAVPIFSGLWGLEVYGIWLICFAVPSYLALVDLGYTGAVANEMTAQVAKGETGRARRLFRQLTGATIAGLFAVFCLMALLLNSFGERWLNFAADATDGEASNLMIALVAYSLTGMATRAIFTALRATGHYAIGSYVVGGTALLNVLLACGLALAGAGLLGAALGYAIGEMVGLITMLALKRRYAPDFHVACLPEGISSLAGLNTAAIALFAVAIGQAMLLQGSVIALGAAAGAAAVPAFVAARTLARFGIQMVAVFNLALMPEITMAAAREDRERSSDLVALNLVFALAILVPGSLLLALFGSEVIELWSGGVIHASPSLIVVMAGVMLAGGLWSPMASFLTARNRQDQYAFALLVLSALGVALTFSLAGKFGASGAALSILAVDIVLLGWTFNRAGKSRFFDAHSLRAAPARAGKFILSRLR